MTTSYSREVHHCSPRVFFVRFAICASFGHCDCGRSLNVSYILALFRLKVHQLQHVTRCGILHRTPGRRIVQILVSSSFILALRRLLGLAIVAIPSVFLSFLCSSDCMFIHPMQHVTRCQRLKDASYSRERCGIIKPHDYFVHFVICSHSLGVSYIPALFRLKI